MILERVYDEGLAQASYLVGCAATGEALVVDPNRDIDAHLDRARRHRLRITHVTETHIHADFVSGARELAARTGAALYLSDEGGPDWRYAFADEDGAILLHDGDTFMVGNIRIEAVHTPGHTPEHLTFIVTDTAGADAPMGAFTGDFIFVGDVGRPDLLERAAKLENTMESAARRLFASIQAFSEMPDYLQIWPGHGAGSACGKALGAVPQSTLGYEKRFNWAFGHDDEDGFVRAVLEGQPDPPTYFARMKRVNRDGPIVLGGLPDPSPLAGDDLAAVLRAAGAAAAEGAISGGDGPLVLDVRPAADFAARHVPGALNTPVNRSFTKWAGWLLPYDRDLYLIASDDHAARELRRAVRELALIGFDRIAGHTTAGRAARAVRTAGGALETIARAAPGAAAERLEAGAGAVLDVRGRDEWMAGHIPGVPNIPLGELPNRMHEVPGGRPLIVHCQTGGRSAIAASLLQAMGVKDVENLDGGFAAWRAEDRAVERGATSAGPASPDGESAGQGGAAAVRDGATAASEAESSTRGAREAVQ